jgi:hypothetical protein
MTLEQIMLDDSCRARCSNDPICFTPGAGLSWAQDMGGAGRGLDVNDCAAYKLRDGSSYMAKSEIYTSPSLETGMLPFSSISSTCCC